MIFFPITTTWKQISSTRHDIRGQGEFHKPIEFKRFVLVYLNCKKQPKQKKEAWQQECIKQTLHYVLDYLYWWIYPIQSQSCTEIQSAHSFPWDFALQDQMCCRREDPDALAIDLLWHLSNLDLKLKSAEPSRKAAGRKRCCKNTFVYFSASIPEEK